MIVWTGHNAVDLAVWALRISFVKMSQRFQSVFIADLRTHLDFSLFLMWRVSIGIFSPLNMCFILLRPVCGVNCLLEVVIGPFYQHCFHQAIPSPADTFLDICRQLLESCHARGQGGDWLNWERGWCDYLSYSTACFLEETIQLEANSLASCLASPPLLQDLWVQDRQVGDGTLPMPWILF